MRTLLVLLIAILAGAAEAPVPVDLDEALPAVDGDGVRLKDLCEIYGVRDNQLHGVGLVVGLSGTGDKTLASVRMLRQMLISKHLTYSESDLASKNVAMVVVTADLPSFSRKGARLYTQASCIGDANSLRGGVLLQTPLIGPDGNIYAVAQGSVSIGGYGTAGPAVAPTGIDHRNIETVGTVGAGSIVEREVPETLLYGDRLRLVLRDPDFTTASRVARALTDAFGPGRVIAEDSTMVSLGFATAPTDNDLVQAIAKLQQLRVAPDLKARVVINSRTGTVVSGAQVRISTVAVSHGGLSLHIMPVRERTQDPNDRGRMRERIVWRDPVTKTQRDTPPAGTHPTEMIGSTSVIGAASVEEIANALNALGARPKDLVAIFEAIQRAGALHAELVVM